MEDKSKNIEDAEDKGVSETPKNNFIETWTKFLRSSGSKEKNTEPSPDKTQELESFNTDTAQEQNTSTRLSEPERIGSIARRVGAESTGALSAEATSLEKEKEELHKQQLAFEKQLDKKIKLDTNTGSDTKSVEGPEHDNNLDQVSSTEELKEILKTDPSTRPEVIMERVKVAAAHDIPIESLYEKRHELKDDADEDDLLALDARLVNQRSSNTQPKEKSFRGKKDSPVLSEAPSVTTKEKQSGQSGLYKQAIVSGFWTAAILVAVIFILILLS
ncbi:MAG TPA: hypothetical protein VJJ78_00405 [Candidatus Saccharimonadales bacterium]|nr:hypothetical protein [Candidatus Saccharimonadales bacterium]